VPYYREEREDLTFERRGISPLLQKGGCRWKKGRIKLRAKRGDAFLFFRRDISSTYNAWGRITGKRRLGNRKKNLHLP